MGGLAVRPKTLHQVATLWGVTGLCYIPHLRVSTPSSFSPRNSLCWLNCYFSSDTGCTYSRTQMFTATNSQKLERIQSPSTKWINKLQHIHTMKYYSAIKRNALPLNPTTQENTKRSCFLGNTFLPPKHRLLRDRRHEKGHEGFELCGGYMGVYNCQNSKNWICEMGVFGCVTYTSIDICSFGY